MNINLESWFLVLEILHGVRGKFPDDVSGTTASPETPSENLPRTPWKIPKTKYQYSFHGESLKSKFWILFIKNETLQLVLVIEVCVDARRLMILCSQPKPVGDRNKEVVQKT